MQAPWKKTVTNSPRKKERALYHMFVKEDIFILGEITVGAKKEKPYGLR